MNDLIEILTAGGDLSAEQAAGAARALLEPERTEAERAGFLRALSRKGETPVEIEAFARVFLDHAVDPGLREAELPGPMLDIVGTGGDRLDLFNVSTTSMFVLAGGGVCVVKHGNRAITSKSGGADVLEALGVKIDLSPERLAEGVKSAGLGFLFAPLYHPAFKMVGPARKILAEEGVRTIFNLLGPLLNPARPPRQLIGVAEEWLGPIFANQMERLGRESAWIVHGRTDDDRGMDEASIMGPTRIWQWNGRAHSEEIVYPWQFELDGCPLEELQGADAATNAAITRGILDGTIRDGRRRMVAYNAAAGFVAAGLADDIPAGLALARQSIDSGAAEKKLTALAALA
jgi:anthranilate phosphoribosyltransferase